MTQQGEQWVRGQSGKPQPHWVWKEALYPPGMRQSDGVKPRGLGQREWGAGWGLSLPQHRVWCPPSAQDNAADMCLTSKPEGVSKKMGWGRQIPGLGIFSLEREVWAHPRAICTEKSSSVPQ